MGGGLERGAGGCGQVAYTLGPLALKTEGQGGAGVCGESAAGQGRWV